MCRNQDDSDQEDSKDKESDKDLSHQKAEEESKEGTCTTRPVEATFNLVFFDWPVGYRMRPGRALQILVVLILFFAIPYCIAILVTREKSTPKKPLS